MLTWVKDGNPVKVTVSSESPSNGQADEMSRYEKVALPQDLSLDAIQREVERILASEKFARSKRLSALLRFTVAQTLEGNAHKLKEYVIGTAAFKKPESYDTRSDSLVRVLASRLRVALKEYYSDGGSEDPLVIEFPKGKYVPKFQRRERIQSEAEKKTPRPQCLLAGTFSGHPAHRNRAGRSGHAFGRSRRRGSRLAASALLSQLTLAHA